MRLIYVDEETYTIGQDYEVIDFVNSNLDVGESNYVDHAGIRYGVVESPILI